MKNLVGRVRTACGEFFSVPDGYEVILGNGGATAFWDAAAFGLIDKRSLHLSFGEFSAKFASSVADNPFVGDPIVVKAEPAARPNRRATRRSTSSRGRTTRPRRGRGAGQPACRFRQRAGRHRCDVRRRRPAGRRRRDRRLLLRPAEVLASDGGLWLAIMSPAALGRIEKIAASGPLGARLPVAAHRHGQQPQEPDVQHPGDRHPGADGGPARVAARQRRPGLGDQAHRRLLGPALLLGRGRAYTTPFVTDPKLRSQVVGTIDFNDDVDAAAVAKVLRANGIVDIEPYRKLGRNQLRVAMFPAVDPDDVSALTECMDWVVERI